MADVMFDIVNTELMGKHSYKLSHVDMGDLKYYAHQHNHVPIGDENFEGNNEENNFVDFYLNNIFTTNSQPLIDNYQPRQELEKPTKFSPITSFSLNNYNRFAIETAICGMQKNKKLPVPYKNFSLTDGSFGDDAGFVIEKAHENFIGISDGAGGNAMLGYNPRLFSECLMRHCSNLAHTGKYSTSNPKRLLCHAFDRVQIDKCYGSATACILGIDCDAGRLYSVNIGDSGYIIVRQGSVIHRSQSQEMNGDCPRQLDVYPWTASLKGHGLNYTQISSHDAICESFDLESDDIIILSTDGLFDNVPHHVIERILARNRHSLKNSANELVTRAVRYYVKPDDILVIMVRITLVSDRFYGQPHLGFYL